MSYLNSLKSLQSIVLIMCRVLTYVRMTALTISLIVEPSTRNTIYQKSLSSQYYLAC